MFDDLKNLFRGNNIIGQLVVVNVIVFVLFNLLENIVLRSDPTLLTRWFALNSDAFTFITRPWSIVTYMFMHGGFGHILWNMLFLYWFGKIFRDFLGNERLTGLFFLGGIAGGLLYFLSYNMMYLMGNTAMNGVPLVGASAAVMAIVIAVGARFPDYYMNLLLIGPVKLRYVALAAFILSTVLDFQSNMGGKIAHLGGAAVGYFYVRGLNQGQDWAMGFYQWMNNLVSIFKPKPKIKVVHSAPKSSSKRSSAHKSTDDQARIDAILDKISKSGYDNLSKEEKDFLFKMSNN